jgi:hypothetical protein
MMSWYFLKISLMTITQHALFYNFHTSNLIFEEIFFLKFLSMQPLLKAGTATAMETATMTAPMMTMETKAMAATCLCRRRRRHCCRRQRCALTKLLPHPLSWPQPPCCHTTNATPITLATATANTAPISALINVTVFNHQLNLNLNNNPTPIIYNQGKIIYNRRLIIYNPGKI